MNIFHGDQNEESRELGNNDQREKQCYDSNKCNSELNNKSNDIKSKFIYNKNGKNNDSRRTTNMYDHKCADVVYDGNNKYCNEIKNSNERFKIFDDLSEVNFVMEFSDNDDKSTGINSYIPMADETNNTYDYGCNDRNN